MDTEFRITALQVADLKWRQATWLGQKGEHATVQINSNRTGLRVTVLRWLEDGKQGQAGEVHVSCVYGAPHKGNFARYTDETYSMCSDGDLADAIEVAMAEGLRQRAGE